MTGQGVLYGYCIGVSSSRRVAQRLHEDVAFRVLAANNTPDFRTISNFRKDHLAALEAKDQPAAEHAEVEGKTHPGEPEDKAQCNFTDAESRIMPAPVGRDFLQAYYCQAVVDHAHQVIVAARGHQPDLGQGAGCGDDQETIDNVGAVPGECPSTPVTTRQR